ncbi:caspase Dronc [Ceratina calcarata]|uniref:Caspase Dronc n=1 Tax=Ceratina calcarata TaxID=156304 RepID=A0AAJ7SBW2_9HYME|nr:caspase Dronc [Ceratina calcarata]XP_026674421.1 caspase Dronc [Ceratina calcarata]
MDQEHRELIDSCCNYIIPNINMEKLWPKLLQNKVYNIEDVNIQHWENDIKNEAVIRDIVLTIKTRGPKAFTRLLASLRQSDHEDLADCLEGKRELVMNSDIETTVAIDMQDKFYLGIHTAETPLKIQVRKATEFLDGSEYDKVQKYPMRSKPRGLVLILTNIKYNDHIRKAADVDESNVKDLFEQMGFQVFIERNLTSAMLTSTIKTFSEKSELRKVDSCFVIISSHGNKNAEYEASEIECVPMNNSDPNKKDTVLCKDILKYFTAESCPNLAGKPKTFIFQLCRGNAEQTSVKHSRQVTDAAPSSSHNGEITSLVINEMTIRNQGDTLLAYATLLNNVAFRDNEVGSWFLQILCEVFMNHAYDTHLLNLLLMVDERLKVQRTNNGNCQTMEISLIGFNRNCYLNPGLFEET